MINSPFRFRVSTNRNCLHQTMASETSSSLAGEFVTMEQILQDGIKIDENRYCNTWLTDLPDLAEECRTKSVASVVGETLKVDKETFQVGNVTFGDIAQLVTPKRFPRQFPLQRGTGKVSRILLRREFIKRWNKRIESLGRYGYDVPSKHIVLSAAGGLGKSIDLYLFAVFAKHCRIPVQYIANTAAWLNNRDMSKVVSLYLKMLLFMNADILDELPNFTISKKFNVLNLPLKNAMYFAMKTENISLAMEISDFMTEMEPRNFLIVDEHNAFWRDFGGDVVSTPCFVRSFTNIRVMSGEYCGFIFAGPQHYEFEVNLPSGYTRVKDYIAPLNFEEFKLWQRLPDYPPILREHSQQVIELTGLVPGMIANMVSIAKNNPQFGFEEWTKKFRTYNYPMMKRKHDQYVMSLKYEGYKEDFVKMLLLLFLGDKARELFISVRAYSSCGLLITMENGTLRFYNNIARDILFDTFSNYFLTWHSLEELSNNFSNTPGTVQRLEFAQKFFLWCLYKCSSGELYLGKHRQTIQFESTKLIRMDRKHLNPPVPKITDSCWIVISDFCPRLDFAYLDLRDDGWNLYLVQASSFPEHSSQKSTGIELLFEPPERAPLVFLLNLFLGQTDFQVSTVLNESDKVVNFEVTDSNGHSYRDRISILYITPRTRQEAKVSEAPSYVECITLEDFSEDCKRYLGLESTGRVKRSRQ